MKDYLILDFTILNISEFMEYVNKIPEHLYKHDGKYLVEGVTPTVLEGDWKPNKIVVLEFNSAKNLDNFLEDSAVKNLFTLRHGTTKSNLIRVNGGSWRDEM